MREEGKKKYTVRISNKVKKSVKKMPVDVQDRLSLLIEDIKNNGAIQSDWQNFSSLGNEKYHCHLNYRWVACWYWKKNTFVVEVYYAGSREKAPY